MSGGYLHVLREVDTGEEHSLRYPGRTLIGRARVNDIQPNHGSVSKQHAVVELGGDPQELYTVATVEDFHTRNGTFAGHPDRLNIINGKRPLKMGEYLKFGDCKNLYIFEAIRNPDLKPEGAASPLRGDPVSPLRGDHREDSVFDDRTVGRGLDRGYSQAATAGGDMQGAPNRSTMSISINYPADPDAQRQAVSIQIDPRGEPARVVTQAAPTLSPTRVSFDGSRGVDQQQPHSSSSRRVVSALGELDLSGDFDVQRSEQRMLFGSLSMDAQPRRDALPSPAIAPDVIQQPTLNTILNMPSRQMSPVTVLTEKEREDVERMRQSLSDGIRATNQVLAGVLRFEDWRLHARKIIGDAQLAVQLPVDVAFTARGIHADVKAGQDAAAATERSALQREVARELAAEKPLPLEATMTGRLSAAMQALRGLPMVAQPAGVDRGTEYDRSTVRASLTRAVDDILGAVETPLGMALEGMDSVTPEKDRSSDDPVTYRSVNATDMTRRGGRVRSLRSAVSKLRGLDVFFENMAPATKPSMGPLSLSQSGHNADRSWWQTDSSTDGRLFQQQGRVGGLAELIRSVELAGPAEAAVDAAPASALSKEQLDQIAKYIVLNVLEEDIQPMLDRIADEKASGRSQGDTLGGFSRDRGNAHNGSRSPGIKHSELADMEKNLLKLSTSFGEAGKKGKVRVLPVDLEGGIGPDGELRISSVGAPLGLNLSKLPPLGKALESPRGGGDATRKLRSSGAISAGGSVGGQSIHDQLSMSVEHVEQLEAVDDELENLEKKHKEELERLAAAAEADRLKLQSLSEHERREAAEARRREREMLEAEMAGQRNALLQERQRVLEEAEVARQTMVQYITYKVLTRMLDLYRVKVQSAFKRWAFMALSFNNSRIAIAVRMKQLKRVLNLVSNGVARLIHKAFRKWIDTALRTELMKAKTFSLSSQQELLRLREQCKSSSEQLRDVAKGSDVFASLLAEKALNRELTSSNIQLFDTLNEAQLRVLEMAKIPTAEGKKLVRDVIMTREGELARSRREVRALRERIEHLEGVITGARAAAAEGGRDFASHSEQSKYRGGAVPGGLEVPGFMSSFVDPAYSGGSRSPDHTRSALEAIDHLAPIEQKKKQALSIILMELTRLRKLNSENVASKQYLSDTIAKHLAKISDLEVVSHVLQQRVVEKSRREASIFSFLESSFDAAGLNRLNDFMAELDGLPADRVVDGRRDQGFAIGRSFDDSALQPSDLYMTGGNLDFERTRTANSIGGSGRSSGGYKKGGSKRGGQNALIK